MAMFGIMAGANPHTTPETLAFSAAGWCEKSLVPANKNVSKQSGGEAVGHIFYSDEVLVAAPSTKRRGGEDVLADI